MSLTRSGRVAFAVFATSFVLLYLPVLRKLVFDWAHDDNYSHGFFIIPIAAYFAWERRQPGDDEHPSWSGLLLILASLGLLIVGTLGAELFLTRVSIVGTVAGTIACVLGWRALRRLMFPVAFLLLMIPIPSIVFNQIAFPLQLLASRVGEATLSAARIPVLREGNVITLAHTTLEVAEACSGIRSLISLLSLGIVFGYFADPRAWFRVVLALSTIPIAIIANASRVAGTGIAAHHFGAGAADGFFHLFSGWIVFVVAFAMLFVAARVLLRLKPNSGEGGAVPAMAGLTK
jgi:exosortase